MARWRLLGAFTVFLCATLFAHFGIPEFLRKFNLPFWRPNASPNLLAKNFLFSLVSKIFWTCKGIWVSIDLFGGCEDPWPSEGLNKLECSLVLP